MNYINFLWQFLILYLVIFLVDYFLIKKRRLNNKGKKKKKKKDISELNYLISRFKLDKKKLNIKKTVMAISLVNAFIISFVATLVMWIPLDTMWLMLIAFVLLFALIYALYELMGRILKKVEESKK